MYPGLCIVVLHKNHDGLIESALPEGGNSRLLIQSRIRRAEFAIPIGRTHELLSRITRQETEVARAFRVHERHIEQHLQTNCIQSMRDGETSSESSRAKRRSKRVPSGNLTLTRITSPSWGSLGNPSAISRFFISSLWKKTNPERCSRECP